MPLVQHGHPGFDEKTATEDRLYLNEINQAVIGAMRLQRSSHPGVDYFMVAIQTGETSAVSAIPREKGLAQLTEELNRDPNPLFQDVVDRIRASPSSPVAKWIIICRNGSFRLCSVVDVDISRPGGST